VSNAALCPTMLSLSIPRLMSDHLPTARDYLKSNVRLLIWCKACRHQIEIGFPSLVEQARAMCRSCI
jgi:hypothetical protein